jgi:hypothetical protein
MGFGNSPGQHTVIALEARRSFAFGLQFKKVSGEAVSLTGATVRFVLAQPPHKGGTVLLTKTATAVDLALGLVQVELQAADLDLAEAEYPFAVTLVSAAGYSTPVMKGSVDLRENADPDTSGTYTGFNPSTEMAVYLEDGGLVEVRVAQLDGMTLQVQGLLTSFSQNMAAELEEAQGHALLAETHATNAGVSADAALSSAEAAALSAFEAAVGASPEVFAESVQDAIAAMLTSGTNVTLTYNDVEGTLQVSAAGGDAEFMRDTIGAALVGVGDIAVNINDAGDTISIAYTGTGGGGGGAGGAAERFLGRTTLNNAAETNRAFASTTPAKVAPGSELDLTVTVPDNGEVLWTAHAMVYHGSTVNDWALLSLLDGTGALIAGSQRAANYGKDAVSSGAVRYEFLETGLIAGTSVTRRLGASTNTGANQFYITYGAKMGPVIFAAEPTEINAGGGGGGGGPVVLAVQDATPSAMYSISDAAGAEVDIDATNLAVAFTAPASGEVLIDVEGLVDVVGGAVWEWTLREGTTTLKARTVGSGASYGVRRAGFRVAGLTPGSSHTYKWGWRRLGSGTGTMSLYTGGAGGANGNARMVVTAVGATGGGGGGGLAVVSLTQSEYDALDPADPDTLYVIVG